MAGLALANTNPGNLRDPATGNFRQFSSPGEGYAALLNDLEAKKRGNTSTGLGPDSNLVEFAEKYAPESDNNNPGQYAANLANFMGVRPDAKLKDLDTGKWAEAVSMAEDGDYARSQGIQPAQQSSGYATKAALPEGTGTPKEETTTDKLGNRAGQVSTALQTGGKGIGELMSGHVGRGLFDVGSGVLQTAGAAAGGAGDVIGGVLGVIPGVKQAEGLIGKGVQKLAETDTGQKAIRKGEEFAENHPVLAADIGAVGNIASLAGGGIGAKVGKDVVKKGVYDAAREGLLGSTAKGLVDENAVKVASKVLGSTPTKNEIKAAVRSGRTSSTGGIPGIIADAQKQDSIKEVANLVKEGKVSGSALSVKNAEAIKTAADSEAEQMRSLIRNREIQSILQPEQIAALEQQVMKRAGSSATSGENPAKDILRVFRENLPKQGAITAEDVLNARQAVSRYVLENRGDWNMRGVLTGFKSARDAFWDESRNLLKEMAPDVPIEEMLKKQSSLYRALDYIVPNVKKELGTTPFSRFSERHPNITGLIKGGLKATGTGVAAGLGIKGFEEL